MILGTRKCKVCGEIFQKKTPLHCLCSGACAVVHIKAQAEKKKELELKESKRETKAKREAIKPRSKWLSEAQAIFNKFIRLRDENLPCVSCGRYHSGKYDAGHYRTVGGAAHLRFSEDNCHKQCAPCNNHLSGNIVNYRAGIIAKIGIERVEAVENNNATHKWTREELIAIKSKYKAMLKEIN
jgi:hypothetical protein